MEKRKLNSYIQMMFFLVAWISALACLIRTDYNFAMAFFCYYIFISVDEASTSKIIIIVNAVLCVIDFIWMLSIGGIWTTSVTNDEAWNREESLRTFSIVMSAINLVVKVIICGLVYLYKRMQLEPENEKLNSSNVRRPA